MESAFVRAIKLSKMENDLTDLRRKIAMHEGVINSINTSTKMKKNSKSTLVDLVRRRETLMSDITEMSLLES